MLGGSVDEIADSSLQDGVVLDDAGTRRLRHKLLTARPTPLTPTDPNPAANESSRHPTAGNGKVASSCDTHSWERGLANLDLRLPG